MTSPSPDRHQALTGCLLGTAAGDALGLAMEGLSRERQKRWYPALEGYHFFFGRGMISDDTEHACITAQALIESGADPERFARRLAGKLRMWLLALPAGIGFATLRSLMKLFLGFSPEHSGVFSAGNGPAMRSPVIGVAWGHEPKTMCRLVRASTRITHSDPKAEYGALAVALAAYLSARGETDPTRFFSEWTWQAGREADELTGLIAAALASHLNGETTETFAETLNLSKGVTGYMYHTVPVVLHLWFRHAGDFKSGIIEACRLGGDTDTVAAILGGISGAGVGKNGIPAPWISGLMEWPRSVRWMEGLVPPLLETLDSGQSRSAPGVPWVLCFLRNLFFAGVVLAHGLRRALPPY